MPTIIDELLVRLRLDGKDAVQDAQEAGKALDGLEKSGKTVQGSAKKTGEAVTKSGKDMADAHKKSADGFDKVAKNAMKFLAVIGGVAAIRSFILHTTESNAALGYLAANLGMAVGTVAAWGQAVEQLGGSAKEAQAGFTLISKAQTDMMFTGQSNLMPFLSQLGVSLADASGKARPMNDVMLDIADSISKIPGGRQAQHNYLQMMGFGESEINLLLKGRHAVEDMIKAQKDSIPTPEQIEKSQRFQAALAKTKQHFEQLGQTLMEKALPWIEKALKFLDGMAAWADKNPEKVQTALLIIAGGLTAIVLATIPISATVLALALLAGAFVLLWEDYEAWAKGAPSAFDWSGWRDTLKDVGYVVKALVEDLKQLAEWMNKSSAISKFSTGSMTGDITELGKELKDTRDAFKYEGVGAGIKTLFTGKSAATQKEGAAMQFFMSKEGGGYSLEQAAGIVGNLKRESTTKKGPFDVGAVGDQGKAFGIGQWHANRQELYRKYMGGTTMQEDVAKDPAMAYAKQLAFVRWEHEHTEKEAEKGLRRATSATQAGASESRLYERPAKKEEEARERGRLAEEIAVHRLYLKKLEAGRSQPDRMRLAASHAQTDYARDLTNRSYDYSTTTGATHNTQIENNWTINAPSGDARDIADTIKPNLHMQAASGYAG